MALRTLDKYFEPAQHEREIYERWEKTGAFVADPSSEKEPFTISMPPPNATGTLHTGHAVMLAVEDLMSRYQRMKGREVLWLPGTDHAAIATESVVIRALQSEGMTDPRQDLGRDELVRRIAQFVSESRDTIRRQIRAMGSSCDWSRERYTMDPALSRCVNAVFGRMFRDGLIYRGPRIVNWDPHLQTTVSDDEIYHQDRPAKFYTLRYGPFLVGTSRPETKLGDTGIAVHPDDERWREHIGKTYDIPWPKGPTITVKVVADERVDPDFGTGALGVTPAHSHVDFDIAQKYGLPLVQVIDEDGRMTEAAGEHYAGMAVEECRAAFAAELEAAGLLENVEEYVQPMSLCYRSKKPVEPLPKEQWFINVDEPAVLWKGRKQSLKQVLRDAVASGDIRILPDHQERTYFHWIDNLRDWCISRQIWWGHRIPVWYRGDEDMYVGHLPPSADPAKDGWTQDEDTLDTWFSSALWTWSTLVDPELAEDPTRSLKELLAGSPDYAKFHPTSVMETGYDILFFWVARMILMTTYATGEVPFETVYLHGLILDKDGDKMSKSKPETAVDPLEVIEEHGADVLRLSMVLGNGPGQDLKLTPERMVGCKRLINKIWNAAKLVDLTLGRILGEEEQNELPGVPGRVEHPVNRWMLARLRDLVENTTRRLDSYYFGDAAEQIRGAFWGEFCDFYLEAIKVEPLNQLRETAEVLRYSLATYLKLFHPYLPFVTEHLWSALLAEDDDDHLMLRAWPVAQEDHHYADDAAGVAAVERLVGAIRALRNEQGLEPGAQVELVIRPLAHADALRAAENIIARLVRAESLTFTETDPGVAEGAAMTVDPSFQAAVRLGRADLEAERRRLEKQLAETEKRLAGLERQLANEQFVTRANPKAVESVRKNAEDCRATVASVRDRLAAMG
ncbi:MAG: valine--tRNA ligase [Thermoanaerobaculia bacterium]|nr:valine--tRNA ligase [Thermoanaerobaculia bacterium]